MPRRSFALPFAVERQNKRCDSTSTRYSSKRADKEIIVVRMNTILTRTRSLQVVLLTGALLFGAGCNRQTATQPARTDQQISNDVQAKISAEGALNGQNIQVAVANGV